MRIAFIVHDYTRTRGRSRYVVELAARYAREHEVHVFAGTIEVERDPRIQYHGVFSLRIGSLFEIVTFMASVSCHSFKEFDIVHAQGFCGFHQNVITAHSCYAAWSSAHRKQLGGQALTETAYFAIVNRLEKCVLQVKQSAAVIAVSKHVKGDIGYYYGRVEDISVVYHGVNLVQFNPDNRLRWRSKVRSDLKIGNDKFVALYVGDLQKGAIPAIEAIARVDGARLVCISESDPKPFLLFAQKMEVSDRVLFLPTTDVIERYYSAADVFLMPSCYETFGMAISEAMASGLPSIMSSDTGASELIEHGVSGVVIEPAWNVNAVAEWLKRLRDDVDLHNSMSTESRRKIEHYTWEDTAIETMRVYKDVLAKKKS